MFGTDFGSLSALLGGMGMAQQQKTYAYCQQQSIGSLFGVQIYTHPRVLDHRCRYCGNSYQREAIATKHNCPTCAGSWE